MHKQKSIDSLFSIQLPDGQIYSQLGKIAIIDRAVDPQTGTIDVRLSFPNPKYLLRAGLSCVVRVHNQDAAPQIVVPSRAVVEQMGEYFLYLAKDTILKAKSDSAGKKGMDSAGKKGADTVETPKLRAFQVKVQLGQTIGPNVVIKSGIKEGDSVIVDGVQAIHEGSQINASSRPAGAAGADSTGGHHKGTANMEGDSSKKQ